jgi:hypothetical protein
MKKGTTAIICLFFLLGGLMLLPPAPLNAQDADISGIVVTGLEALTRNNLVRLSWKDAPEAGGPVYIYRSFRPFQMPALDGSPDPIFSTQRPAEVPYGVESYIDDVGSSGRVYYFIAASGEGGARYLELLPSVNTVAVDIAESPETAAAAASPQPPGPGGISGLEVRPEGEGVVIRYRLNRTGNTILYRSVQPITHTADLLSAVIVRSGLSPPLADYPVPGIPYYYAVIFEDELARGTVGIYPGQNATLYPVEVTADRVGLPRAAELRSMPLPLISLNYAVPGIDTFSELRNPIPLGLPTAKAMGTLRRTAPASEPQRTSRAFGQDLETENYGVSGEDRALRNIVQGSFTRGNWEAARDELNRYLSVHRGPMAEARARYYRGQTLYFLGSYRDAFFEFLLINGYFPVEVHDWMEACLAVLLD